MNEKSNTHLWQRREDAVARGVGSVHQRFAASAHNDRLVDAEGREYVDFATGIAVCNTGHGDPRVLGRVREQLDRFSHACFQVTPYESYVALAERLNAAVPGNSPKKTLFVTTGAEAVENAVKIARAHTGRQGVVAFRGGYHGRTLMTLALTGKVAPYKASFGTMPAGVFHARYPAEYLGTDSDAAIASLHEIFAADIAASDVAAIIVEPVLGEGGFYMAPPAFMRQLRDLCDEYGIVLIVDEIQTGFARTGRLFAVEHSGIEPDLMTVAKALAGGFPIAGVVGKAEIMDAPGPGGLGGTYGGSPLGCVAGLAVLDIVEEDGLCARADEIGGMIRKAFSDLREEGIAEIGDIRGPGAMVAVEFVEGGDVARPAAALTRDIVARAADAGVILLSCGIRGNVIRFLPALTAEMDTIARGLDQVTRTVRDCVAAHREASAPASGENVEPMELKG